MILKCSCNDTWTDKKYGNAMRVHNKTSKTNPQMYRCTVCKKERTESK